MTTETGTTERTDPPGAAAAPAPAAAPTPASIVWLRRSVVALGVATAIMVVTGLYLTFRYQPGSRADDPAAAARSRTCGRSMRKSLPAPLRARASRLSRPWAMKPM